MIYHAGLLTPTLFWRKNLMKNWRSMLLRCAVENSICISTLVATSDVLLLAPTHGLCYKAHLVPILCTNTYKHLSISCIHTGFILDMLDIRLCVDSRL